MDLKRYLPFSRGIIRFCVHINIIYKCISTINDRFVRLWLTSYQLLEEVAHTLLGTPVLDSGQQSIVEVLVDLVELRHFEEDGVYLLDAEHGLRRCGCSPQGFHGLDK